MSSEEKVVTKKQTVAEMEEELKSLELQAAKLAILEKEANLQDVRERLAERQMIRETKSMRAITNGQTVRQTNAAIKPVSYTHLYHL